MPKNKVTFGLEQVHVAFLDETSPTQPAWEAPIPIPGAVRWTPDPQGESETFYADNGPYFVVTSNNGYTSELEIALLPDEIKARMLGWKIDDNGALIEVADGKPEKFAIMGQIQGDKRNRRFVYYDVQASRPSKELTTKGESTEVNPDVLPVTVSPIRVDERTIVKGDLELNESNAEAYNSFFEEVYLPVFGGDS